MLNYKYCQDNTTEWLETSLSGKALLTIPQLNKSTAFSIEERHQFGLLGKLPLRVETLEEQVQRAYQQFLGYTSDIQKNIYLNNLHDKNQVLFYQLVSQHLTEMIPLIYTPIVGTAVKRFSHEYRQARGLYLSYPERESMSEVLDNRSNPDIDLIVVTDGEAVLGIGDQGIGGIDIPIAKLMVYTLFGGINPLRTLPIQLDVGTNNPQLLNNPFYLGWRHERLKGSEYESFIEQFITTVQQKFPDVFLHWEDFGRNTARANLDKAQAKLCSFNDDIQGTGVVTLAALLAAMHNTHSKLSEQRIVIFGAGTAGIGIADQICSAMVREGLNLDEARKRFWLLDSAGLVTQARNQLVSGHRPYARSIAEVSDNLQINNGHIGLLQTVQMSQPTVLIGCSGVANSFTETVVKMMAKHTERPIIFTLSNPTENSEAQPADLLRWTDNRALIAAGSPFDDVIINSQRVRISQCNNALAFPGIGLGVLAVKAKRLTDNMVWAACTALSACAPKSTALLTPLLPPLENAWEASRKIAIAVAEAAFADNVAQAPYPDNLADTISKMMWIPKYMALRKINHPMQEVQ